MKRSNLYFLFFFMILIAYPLYYYRSKPIEERRVAAKLARKKAVDSNSATLGSAEDAIPFVGLAVQIAEVVLKEKYGAESVEKQKPFIVNLNNGVWIVEGNPSSENGEAQTYVRISKRTGAILGTSSER